MLTEAAVHVEATQAGGQEEQTHAQEDHEKKHGKHEITGVRDWPSFAGTTHLFISFEYYIIIIIIIILFDFLK